MPDSCRDLFIIHPADRAACAPSFAERERRVRAGAAQPFEVIEDPTRPEHWILCMRYNARRTHYATAPLYLDPTAMLADGRRLLDVELDRLAEDVERTLLRTAP